MGGQGCGGGGFPFMGNRATELIGPEMQEVLIAGYLLDGDDLLPEQTVAALEAVRRQPVGPGDAPFRRDFIDEFHDRAVIYQEC